MFPGKLVTCAVDNLPEQRRGQTPALETRRVFLERQSSAQSGPQTLKSSGAKSPLPVAVPAEPWASHSVSHL